MPTHPVSVRGPLWVRAKAHAVLLEMTVSELVEDLLKDALDDAGFRENRPEAIKEVENGPEAKDGSVVKPEDKTEPKN